MNARTFDVCVVGGGAAGLMCSYLVGKSGLKVILVEHNKSVGKKIRISGGGRCNFTNIHTSSNNYVSENKHFHKSALSGYTPQDFIKLVEEYDIPYFEKHKGQLFCKKSAQDIIEMFLDLNKKNNVEISLSNSLLDIEKLENGDFYTKCSKESFISNSVVIATGSLPLESIGASGIGHSIAKKFDHKITPVVPALVPLKLNNNPFTELSGVSLPVRVKFEKNEFLEDLLFTHKGMSGPAILQISLYWEKLKKIKFDFSPDVNMEKVFDKKDNKLLKNILYDYFPKKFVNNFLKNSPLEKKLTEISKKDLNKLKELIHNFQIEVEGDEGWRKAEVAKGGVSTDKISSKTMESKNCSGLYFIGEVLDVTGQLGGFNFQWAWASAKACANACTESL